MRSELDSSEFQCMRKASVDTVEVVPPEQGDQLTAAFIQVRSALASATSNSG